MMLAGGPFGLGPLELVVILLVLVMLFGATRLADIGGSLGKGIREFRKNVKDDEEEEPPAQKPSARKQEEKTSTTPPASDGEEAFQAVRCPTCGTINPAASKHCSECGASLRTPVA